MPAISEKSLSRNVTFSLKALASGSLQVTLTELPGKKIFFPPINPIAPPHNCLEAELLALFISFHCELGHTGSVGVSESAGPKEQQCERPAAFSSLPYSQGGCQVPRMKGILPFLVNAPPITSPAAQSPDPHFSSCP